mgnify:CR=1 FL=1
MGAIAHEHVKTVCRPGYNAQTCRYLTLGASGWDCEKLTSLGVVRDERVRVGPMNAQSDNCEGR